MHVSSKKARRGEEDASDLYGDDLFDAMLAHFPGFSDNIKLLARKPDLIGIIATFVSSCPSSYRF